MHYSYFNRNQQIFYLNSKYETVKTRINEAGSADIPRFKLKKADLFPQLPLNKWVKVTQDKLKLAIENGLILEVRYRTDLIAKSAVKPRNIYPMVLGRSSKGNLLLRGYHLDGFSVSRGNQTEKEWRLFRVDRFVSIRFTGAFFRLPPENYVELDSIMKGGIIAAANFNDIRRRQEKLVTAGDISDKDQIMTSTRAIFTAQIEDLAETIELNNITASGYLRPEDLEKTKITFVKSTIGNKYYAILGVMGEKDKLAKLYEGTALLGTFKVLDSMYAYQVSTNTQLPRKQYSLYMYKGKKF